MGIQCENGNIRTRPTGGQFIVVFRSESYNRGSHSTWKTWKNESTPGNIIKVLIKIMGK